MGSLAVFTQIKQLAESGITKESATDFRQSITSEWRMTTICRRDKALTVWYRCPENLDRRAAVGLDRNPIDLSDDEWDSICRDG